MFSVIFKCDGSLLPSALVYDDSHPSREAAEDFFGSQGEYGGLNDSRASTAFTFSTLAEALAFAENRSASVTVAP